MKISFATLASAMIAFQATAIDITASSDETTPADITASSDETTPVDITASSDETTPVDVAASSEETAEDQLDEIHQCYAEADDAYKTIVFGCIGEDFNACFADYEADYSDLRA